MTYLEVSLRLRFGLHIFNISARVKETFVERSDPPQGEDNTLTYDFSN